MSEPKHEYTLLELATIGAMVVGMESGMKVEKFAGDDWMIHGKSELNTWRSGKTPLELTRGELPAHWNDTIYIIYTVHGGDMEDLDYVGWTADKALADHYDRGLHIYDGYRVLCSVVALDVVKDTRSEK